MGRVSSTFLPIAALLALAGCMTTQPVGPESYARKCDASDTAEFIGQRATQDLGAQIQQRTGAEIFNWIAPGMIVTADYRINRVRVSYDQDFAVTRIACG